MPHPTTTDRSVIAGGVLRLVRPGDAHEATLHSQRRTPTMPDPQPRPGGAMVQPAHRRPTPALSLPPGAPTRPPGLLGFVLAGTPAECEEAIRRVEAAAVASRRDPRRADVHPPLRGQLDRPERTVLGRPADGRVVHADLQPGRLRALGHSGSLAGERTARGGVPRRRVGTWIWPVADYPAHVRCLMIAEQWLGAIIRRTA